MARLLATRGRRLGPATLRGVLLDVGPYPAAVPSDGDADADDRIVGELIELDPARAAETLVELDAYEGCPDRRARARALRALAPGGRGAVRGAARGVGLVLEPRARGPAAHPGRRLDPPPGRVTSPP